MHRQQVRPPIPPRRAGAAIFAPLFFVLAFITALLPVQSAAAQDAQDPPVAAVGPLEAIAFEDPGLRREIGRWRLGPGQASLHIPHLGNSGQGRLSTLLLGQELAAALFPGSLYSGDDHGCHPDLGSDAFPRLFWRGATAAFLPPPGDFWPPQENAAKPGIGAGPFRADGLTAGSLILFRRSAGPPPGILLLSRLKTLGSDCQQMHHRTYYQRLFVPLDDASAEGGCLELALLGTSGAGTGAHEGTLRCRAFRRGGLPGSAAHSLEPIRTGRPAPRGLLLSRPGEILAVPAAKRPA